MLNDYWPSGFKRDKPYTVQHDGRYQVSGEVSAWVRECVRRRNCVARLTWRVTPCCLAHPPPYSLLYCQGRFALVIEAALHYAKLELGIAPSREEQKEEERRQKEEQKEELRQDRLLGEDGLQCGLQNAKQNVCPPKRAKPPPRAAAPLPPPPPRAAAAPPRTRG